jgi:hypothetical protein
MVMRPFRLTVGVAGMAVLGLLVASAVAQQKPATGATKTPEAKPLYAGLDFQSNVGSFKLLGAGDTPAMGKLTFSFTGTVLVSGLEKGSKVTTSGNVRREINDTKHNKAVYHGTGTMTVDGRVRAVQFFGRDVKAKFFGQGIFRLYGEFDKNLGTGTYKYAGSTEVRPWGTGGMTLAVPSLEQATPKPRIRDSG